MPHELGLPRLEAFGPTHTSAGGALGLGLSFRTILRIAGHEPGPNGWNESGKSCVASGMMAFILVVVTQVSRCQGTYRHSHDELPKGAQASSLVSAQALSEVHH
jgi:hypothetical protein